MAFIIRSLFISAMLYCFFKITYYIASNLYSCYLYPSDSSKIKQERYIPAERRPILEKKTMKSKKPSSAITKKKRTAIGESGRQDSNYATYQALKNRYK